MAVKRAHVLADDLRHCHTQRRGKILLGHLVLERIQVIWWKQVVEDQVAFIKDGEVVAARDLRAHPDDEVRVVVRARKLSQEVIAGLTKWTTSSRLDGERLSFVTRSPSDLPDILRHLITAGVDVYEFTPERLSLEDMFMTIMGED